MSSFAIEADAALDSLLELDRADLSPDISSSENGLSFSAEYELDQDEADREDANDDDIANDGDDDKVATHVRARGGMRGRRGAQ